MCGNSFFIFYFFLKSKCFDYVAFDGNPTSNCLCGWRSMGKYGILILTSLKCLFERLFLRDVAGIKDKDCLL